MATMLRPLTTGELLDRTFFLYRKHFLLFVGIMAVPNLAVFAMQTLGALQRGPMAGIIATVVWTLLTLIVYLLALAASQAATVVAVSNVHLDRPATVSGIYGSIKSRIPRFMLIMIGVGIAVGIGFMLLVIPGIIFATMWALVIPVAVLENKGLSESAARSQFLTKGHRLRILLVGILCIVLMYIFTLLWEIPALAVMGIKMRANPATVSPVWMTVVLAAGTFITQCLVGPIMTIALSLIYYDERVRKEAFDLDLMMSTLDGGQADSALSTTV